MASLYDIPGIGESAVQLLAVAKVRDVRDLASWEDLRLMEALVEANGDGIYFTRLPNQAAVSQWVNSARKALAQIIQEEQQLPPQRKVPRVEAPAPEPPAVVEAGVPNSIPIAQPAPVSSAQAPAGQKDAVPSIPVAQPAKAVDQKMAQVIMVGNEEERRALLESATEAIVVDTPANVVHHVTLPRFPGEDDPTEAVPLEVRESVRSTSQLAQPKPRVLNREPDPYAQLESIDVQGSPASSMRAPAPVERKPLQHTKIKSFEDYESSNNDIQPLPRRESVKTDPQRGEKKRRPFKNPNSKLNIKGVLYPSPGRMVLASLIVLGLRLSLLMTLIGTTIMFALSPDQMKLLIPVYITLFFFFLLYITYAVRTRCRICSCPLLYSRNCHKHKQAHRVHLLGMSGSTALHAILFRWFRCMYCGTSIRLKE